MVGRRRTSAEFHEDAQPGDYALVQRDSEWTWLVMLPTGVIGDLGDHDVVVHEDDTITVDPSIQDPAEGGYHGHLVRGVWSP